MELSGDLFSVAALAWFSAAFGAFLLLALWLMPWRRFGESEQLHVFLGACVGLMILWTLRTEVTSGLEFHLLGITTVTLMFGWSLAVIAGVLALLAVTAAGFGDWGGFAVTALTVVVVPATFTQVVLVLVRSALPKHFFIYIFVNAFLTSGLAALATGYLATAMLVATGTASLLDLRQGFLPFLPLMVFPESFLNGALMTVLVGFRPQWVRSFSDREYLHGK